jgi:hypothetical protein
MRDFRDAKAIAQTLRDELQAKSVSVTHSESLELVAKALGFHDWHVLAAKIQSGRRLPGAESRLTPAASSTTGAALDHVDSPGKPVRQEIALDAAILDGYVGVYEGHERPDDFQRVTRGMNSLFWHPRVWPNPSVPIFPQSNTEFFNREGGLQFSFITDGREQAESLICNRISPPRKRIDATTAQQVFDKMAEKVRRQSVSPESETTLRRHIDGLISGKPYILNEEKLKLDPKKAAAIRLVMLQDKLAQSGPLQSIQLLHVSRQGEDVYIVKLERGEWLGTIALNPSGTIYGMSFAPIRTSP